MWAAAIAAAAARRAARRPPAAARRRSCRRATRSRAPRQSLGPQAADGGMAARVPPAMACARRASSAARRRRGRGRDRRCGTRRSPARGRCGARRTASRPSRVSGCFSSAINCGRREVLGDGLDDEIEERAGRRLGERPAGGVVDADAPGFEAHGDAAREQPVGRDQRGGAAGRLGRFAQDERDGLGLVLRRRRFDQADAGERAAHRCRVGRARRSRCQRPVVPDGAHRLGDERLRAPARAAIERGAGEQLHAVGARRRARRAASASRTADARDARRSPPSSPSSRCEIERRAARWRRCGKPRHGAHQLDGRRDRAGDARDDDRALRRRRASDARPRRGWRGCAAPPATAAPSRRDTPARTR